MSDSSKAIIYERLSAVPLSVVAGTLVTRLSWFPRILARQYKVGRDTGMNKLDSFVWGWGWTVVLLRLEVRN